MKAYPFGSASTAGTIARDETLALKLTGQIGPSNSLGEARFGVSKHGDSKPIAGIYQQRRTGYNQHTGPPLPGNKRIIVKMRTYRPTNPQTAPQQAWRAIFASGVSLWQGLTSEQKATYNSAGSRKNLSGFNLYMRGHLRANL